MFLIDFYYLRGLYQPMEINFNTMGQSQYSYILTIFLQLFFRHNKFRNSDCKSCLWLDIYVSPNGYKRTIKQEYKILYIKIIDLSLSLVVTECLATTWRQQGQRVTPRDQTVCLMYSQMMMMGLGLKVADRARTIQHRCFVRALPKM